MYRLKLVTIAQSKSEKLQFSFLVHSRLLEMAELAKNGQNAISMQRNDVFTIIIPILDQNTSVANNS